MAIYKVTISATVLMEAKSAAEVASNLSVMGLADIGRECDDGLWIGSHKMDSVRRLKREQVPDELFAVGNDGDFFDFARG